MEGEGNNFKSYHAAGDARDDQGQLLKHARGVKKYHTLMSSPVEMGTLVNEGRSRVEKSVTR